MSVAGAEFPTLGAFHIALFVAAGAAGLAAVLSLLIPVPRAESAPEPSVSSDDADFVAELMQPDTAPWLDHDAYLVCSRLDETGGLTLAELADAIGTEVSTVGRYVTALLRDGVATGARRGDVPAFYLTPLGRDRFYRQRAVNDRDTYGVRRGVVVGVINRTAP